MSALAAKPDWGIAYNNLGVSYSLSGRMTEAVEAFKAALAHRYKRPKVYNNLGLALANLKRYGQALEAFKQAGTEPMAYNNLGGIYFRDGNYDEAIRCFETAARLDPRFNARVRKNLNIALMHKQRAGQPKP
jgi:Flp pilus assembly protein TadD